MGGVRGDVRHEGGGAVGIGQPALSNLLNRKASLSPKMALRLERGGWCGQRRPSPASGFAGRGVARRGGEERGGSPLCASPPDDQGADIERWADTSGAPAQLPVLVRRLVHATGVDLERVVERTCRQHEAGRFQCRVRVRGCSCKLPPTVRRVWPNHALLLQLLAHPLSLVRPNLLTVLQALVVGFI